jgi:hypothetical protein
VVACTVKGKTAEETLARLIALFFEKIARQSDPVAVCCFAIQQVFHSKSHAVKENQSAPANSLKLNDSYP